MTAYEVYLFLHIGAAIAWVGAGLVSALLSVRVTLSQEDRAVAFAGDMEWLGLRLFLPANLLVLVSAVLLVHEGSWGYGTLWIQLGLAGFGVSFLTGALYFAPGWKRIGKLADETGPDSRDVRERMRLLLLVSRLDLGLLLGIVFVMTVKPEGGDGRALAIAAAIPVAVAAISFALFAAEGRRAPEEPAAAGSG